LEEYEDGICSAKREAGNSDVVDTAGFSAFFAQARQSHLGEVTWKPERCSRVQFRAGERCFALTRNIFAQARVWSPRRK